MHWQNWWLLLLRGIAASFSACSPLPARPDAVDVDSVLRRLCAGGRRAFDHCAITAGSGAALVAGYRRSLGSRRDPDVSMPGLSALVLPFFIAGWAIATSLRDHWRDQAAQGDRQRVALIWAASLVLFGIGMMLAPGAGAPALVWSSELCVIPGVVFVALALRLKKHAHSDAGAPDVGALTCEICRRRRV